MIVLHFSLTETNKPFLSPSGIGEQDHDISQLLGGTAVLGAGRQGAAVAAGGGRAGVGAQLLRNDLVRVGQQQRGCGGSHGHSISGGGGRPAFVFNSGRRRRRSCKWVQDGGGGRGGLEQGRALERDAQQLVTVVGSRHREPHRRGGVSESRGDSANVAAQLCRCSTA